MSVYQPDFLPGFLGYTADESEDERTERHASWAELFFDLVAAAGVSTLAYVLRFELDAAALGLYALLFLAFWLSWTTFMIYSNVAAGQTRVIRLMTGMFGLGAGATQNGQVTVDAGAGLIVTGSEVNGTVTATGASEVEYCGSTQSGTLNLAGTTSVTLGDGGSCAPDTIPSLITVTGTGGQVTVNGLEENGTLTLENNTGGVTVNGSSVSGLVYLQSNTGTAAVTVSGNTVTGSLYCTGNTPAPGDSGSVNTVSGTATGQCAGLAER